MRDFTTEVFGLMDGCWWEQEGPCHPGGQRQKAPLVQICGAGSEEVTFLASIEISNAQLAPTEIIKLPRVQSR